VSEHYFEQALSMLCCWIENPNSDAFKRHLARVADFLWVGEDGMKVRVNIRSVHFIHLHRIAIICAPKLVNTNHCPFKGLCGSIMGCCFRSPSDISV
jgi:hypothetical protein